MPATLFTESESAPPSCALDVSAPPLAWSESRARHYRECKRRYYLRVYAQREGWRPSAAPVARLTWALGHLTTLPLELGSAAHDAASACVRACSAGRPLPDAAQIRRYCGSRLNAAVRRSRQGVRAFLEAPTGRPPMLEEVFYGTPILDADLIQRHRDRLDRVAANLVGARGVWDAVRQARQADVIVVEPFYSFRVEGAPAVVYAAPDLVFRAADSTTWTILDWKSGSRDGVIDQLCTYGVALADGLRLEPTADRYNGRIVALGDGSDETILLTPDDLEDARQRIRNDVRRMQDDHHRAVAVRRDPQSFPELFPPAADPRLCRRCCYRGVCFPELLPSAAATLLGMRGTPRPANADTYGEVAP